MHEEPRSATSGIRPVDWVLSGLLTALGIWLMVEDVTISDEQVAAAVRDGSMAHAMTSHAWAMLPVFLLAPVAVLWWRRSPLSVTAFAVAVLAAHDVLFGWVTRCGAGLPLAFVLTFLVAMTLERPPALVGLALTLLLTALVLVRDATTEISAFVLAGPIVLLIFGIGRAVRHRNGMLAELHARNVELQRLRDERVSLEVAEDRMALSQQLDGLLTERLAQLASAAESARDLGPQEARTVLATIETDSRETLAGMREIVGLLRGGDVALAPAPTVAHLDALLARRAAPGSRLTVTGDPQELPATVELSAYRIVEHLVDVLASEPPVRVDVAVRFEGPVLELAVTGPVSRSADLRSAVRLARERATLLGGSLHVKVSHGRASAVAQLPVTG